MQERPVILANFKALFSERTKFKFKSRFYDRSDGLQRQLSTQLITAIRPKSGPPTGKDGAQIDGQISRGVYSLTPHEPPKLPRPCPVPLQVEMMMDNLFLWWELLSISSLSSQTCSVTAQLVKCWAKDEDVGLNSEGAWGPWVPGASSRVFSVNGEVQLP